VSEANLPAVAAIDRARSHPIRRQILTVMAATQAPLTPSRFARARGGTRAEYHSTQLERAGLIELVREAPGRRGSTKHIYKISAKFTPTLANEVALDRIAEHLESSVDSARTPSRPVVDAIIQAVRASGRPILEASAAPAKDRDADE